MKCWYSELAISKSSVIQGSVNISDMLAIYACSGVHFLIILVVCSLIHSLDSTHVAFFTIRLVLRGFRLSSFNPKFFWDSLSCKLSWAHLLKMGGIEFDSCGGWCHFTSVRLINPIDYASTYTSSCWQCSSIVLFWMFSCYLILTIFLCNHWLNSKFFFYFMVHGLLLDFY